MESSTLKSPLLRKLQSQADAYHQRIPWIRKLPGPAIAIILLLVFVQIIVWIAVGIVLHFHTPLISTAVLSYTLGLRHALDADHISAIDLMTRRLIASGQRPVTVGTFFSLGHSTIVIVTSIVVAASSAAIQKRFDAFSTVGGIIGSSVSSAFLIILGAMNGWILYKLYTALQRAISAPINQDVSLDMTFEGGGCMTMLLKRTFKLVDRPWKMYPLGVLFGLGFDTSSEIALLGISSIQAAKGTSIWLILIFPILFTSGMCLLDTFDGAAMMSLYTSARLAKDTIAVLYYQCVLTAITVFVAVTIGVIQLLTMIHAVRPDFSGPFWDGVDVAGDNYDIIGGSICGSFVVFGILSVILYKPWRRRVDKKREARVYGTDDEVGSTGLGEVEVLGDQDGQLVDASEATPAKNDVKTIAQPVAGESSRG
ncbi:High-affinity nickel transport protein nic1 [Pseudocercospora fuligena]|uniref:Nickel/cobalt efflux system n=1 Tax=Pseudocercospora fuligena TaxID=685502 RepID=A0A8H6RPN8_9PEZI|nr:High-affinity nickel transport protein nic1 [Pseudocercospora fuligena]